MKNKYTKRNKRKNTNKKYTKRKRYKKRKTKTKKKMRGGAKLTETIITNLSLRKDLNWPTEEEIRKIWGKKQNDMPSVIKYFRENNNQRSLSNINKQGLKIAYAIDGVLHDKLDYSLPASIFSSRRHPTSNIPLNMRTNQLNMNQYIRDEMLRLEPSNIYIIETDYDYDKKLIQSWLEHNGINIPLNNIHIKYGGPTRQNTSIEKNLKTIIDFLKDNSINEYTGSNIKVIHSIMIDKKENKIDDLISLRFSARPDILMFFYIDLENIDPTLSRYRYDPQVKNIFRKVDNYIKYYLIKYSEKDKDKNYKTIKVGPFTYNCNGYLEIEELDKYLEGINKENIGNIEDIEDNGNSYLGIKPILNFNGAPGRTIILPENYKLYRAINKDFVKLYGDIKYNISGGLYLTNKIYAEEFLENPPSGTKGKWTLIEFTTNSRLELINLLDSLNLEWLIRLILEKYPEKAHYLIPIIFNSFIYFEEWDMVVKDGLIKGPTIYPKTPRIDTRIPYFIYCSNYFVNNPAIIKDIYSLPPPEGFTKEFDIEKETVNYLDEEGKNYTERELIDFLKEKEDKEMKDLFKLNEILRNIIVQLNAYKNTDERSRPNIEDFKSSLRDSFKIVSNELLTEILKKIHTIIDNIDPRLIYSSIKALEFIIFFDLKKEQSFLRKNNSNYKYYDVEAWLKYKVIGRTTVADKNPDKFIYLLFEEIPELQTFKGYYHIKEPCNTPPSHPEIMVLDKHKILLETEQFLETEDKPLNLYEPLNLQVRMRWRRDSGEGTIVDMLIIKNVQLKSNMSIRDLKKIIKDNAIKNKKQNIADGIDVLRLFPAGQKHSDETLLKNIDLDIDDDGDVDILLK